MALPLLLVVLVVLPVAVANQKIPTVTPSYEQYTLSRTRAPDSYDVFLSVCVGVVLCVGVPAVAPREVTGTKRVLLKC